VFNLGYPRFTAALYLSSKHGVFLPTVKIPDCKSFSTLSVDTC